MLLKKLCSCGRRRMLAGADLRTMEKTEESFLKGPETGSVHPKVAREAVESDNQGVVHRSGNRVRRQPSKKHRNSERNNRRAFRPHQFSFGVASCRCYSLSGKGGGPTTESGRTGAIERLVTSLGPSLERASKPNYRAINKVLFLWLKASRLCNSGTSHSG